jgi:hypothetical protein
MRATSNLAENVARRCAVLMAERPEPVALYYLWRDGVVEMWLETTPIDLEQERELHRLWGQLFDMFPDFELDLRLINPRHFDAFVTGSIAPAGAEKILIQEIDHTLDGTEDSRAL